MKIEICLENLKLGKFSTESEKFSETVGEIWNRGKCIIASGLPGGM